MKNSPSDQRAPAKGQERARLLYAHAARYDPHWHSMPHTHPCAELFFVTGGRGAFRLQDLVYPVRTGDLVIVNTGFEHTETSDRSAPLEYIVLGVEGLEALSPQPDASGWAAMNLQGLGTELSPYLHAAVREMERQEPGFAAVCQGLLDVILVLLIRRANFTFSLADGEKKSSRECAMVRRYIDAHFKENLSLDQLAALAHVNKYYLVHTFTREYGISPINYLISRRIQESRRLLESTNHSLSQISHMLGFSSPSYFSQVFRKQAGVSPQEYRRGFQSAPRREEPAPDRPPPTREGG